MVLVVRTPSQHSDDKFQGIVPNEVVRYHHSTNKVKKTNSKQGLNIQEILALKAGTPILGLGGCLNKATLLLEPWDEPVEGSTMAMQRIILPIEVFSVDVIDKAVRSNSLVQHNLSFDSKEDLLNVLRSYDPLCKKNYSKWYHPTAEKRNRTPGFYTMSYELMPVVSTNMVFGLVLGPVVLMKDGANDFALAVKMFLNDKVGWIFLKSTSEEQPMQLQ